MGNSNNATSQPSVSSNGSSAGGLPHGPLPGFFWSSSLTEVMEHCHGQTGNPGWLGVKLFILLAALPANAGLMWLLLSRKRAMTPSELFGLNVSVLGVLYCLCLPLDIYAALHEASDAVRSVLDGLFALDSFGCPLLLTFMCVERYAAAARPIAFVRLARREYRLLLCACTWTLTLGLGLLESFMGLLVAALPLAVTISLLFLLMLLCLLGIVGVLRQAGPGQALGGSTPLKRRALRNVLAVVVPAVLAYSPVVALVPYMAMITSDPSQTVSCEVLHFLLVFPNFGLLIGPSFYLSHLRQVTCCSKRE